MRWVGLIVVVAALGCSRDNPLFQDADGAGTTSGGVPPSTGTESRSAANTTENDAGSNPDSSSTSTGSTGPVDPTGGAPGCEEVYGPCRVGGAECALGDKCAPIGEPGYYELGCVELPDSPVPLGDSCEQTCETYVGSDNCGVRAACLGDDPQCREICDLEFRECLGDAACLEHASGLFGVCALPCNPLLQDCPDGEGCYLGGAAWECSVDASGAGGEQGMPCAFPNTCDPGLICVGEEFFNGCPTETCCATVCDPSADTCPVGLSCQQPGLPPDPVTAGICGV